MTLQLSTALHSSARSQGQIPVFLPRNKTAPLTEGLEDNLAYSSEEYIKRDVEP